MLCVMMPVIEVIAADWPVPDQIKAVSTTRLGGQSLAPYDDLNLANHVGDDRDIVQKNRVQLMQILALSDSPLWLQQVHGTRIVSYNPATEVPEADGAYTASPQEVLAVMTADCLPVLISNKQGTEVAAVHAGWRGLLNGVIEAAIQRFHSSPEEILVWLGPAIGPTAFEVGDDVRTQFMSIDNQASKAFRDNRPGHWLADIYQLARQRLNRLGVDAVYGGGLCTVTDPNRFFSYRRDGVTGRMASLIWINK